jgi:hypothetical protein
MSAAATLSDIEMPAPGDVQGHASTQQGAKRGRSRSIQRFNTSSGPR